MTAEGESDTINSEKERGTKMSIPVEIERKFVIVMPDFKLLASQSDYTVSEIDQTYLKSSALLTHRVRARRTGGATAYTETKKVRIDRMSVYEDEREIYEAEYKELLAEIMPSTVTLRKTRHTFSYLGHTLEIDVYPNWQRSCVLEIELSGREEEVRIPDFITVIAEVTGDKKYSNASMSASFPRELI